MSADSNLRTINVSGLVQGKDLHYLIYITKISLNRYPEYSNSASYWKNKREIKTSVSISLSLLLYFWILNLVIIINHTNTIAQILTTLFVIYISGNVICQQGWFLKQKYLLASVIVSQRGEEHYKAALLWLNSVVLRANLSSLNNVCNI